MALITVSPDLLADAAFWHLGRFIKATTDRLDPVQRQRCVDGGANCYIDGDLIVVESPPGQALLTVPVQVCRDPDAGDLIAAWTTPVPDTPAELDEDS